MCVVCKCVFMLQFHCTQNPNCATDDRQPSGEVVASSQLLQVSGSNIAAMGGSVVRRFHFFMVALQNRTVLQVSRRSVCLCVSECVSCIVWGWGCVCECAHVCRGLAHVCLYGGVKEIAVRTSCPILCIHNLYIMIVQQ